MATGGHRDRALARANSRGVSRDRPHRSTRPTRLSNQLRQPAVFTPERPREYRLRRRRTAFPRVPDESGIVDDRDRSRHAQPGGHAGVGPDRQGGLPHPGCRARPGDHPAAGNADRAHLNPVPDQHAKHHAGRKPAVHAPAHGRHAQAGRRDATVHRHHAAHVQHHLADGRGHPPHGRPHA